MEKKRPNGRIMSLAADCILYAYYTACCNETETSLLLLWLRLLFVDLDQVLYRYSLYCYNENEARLLLLWLVLVLLVSCCCFVALLYATVYYCILLGSLLLLLSRCSLCLFIPGTGDIYDINIISTPWVC